MIGRYANDTRIAIDVGSGLLKDVKKQVGFTIDARILQERERAFVDALDIVL